MKIKVVHAVTVSKSLIFLRGQINYLGDQGYHTLVICSPGKEVDEFKRREKTHVKIIKMKRDISLFSDFISLINLIVFFMKYRPHIVNAGTPKAGLLVTLAAWLTRVPIRVYTIHGLRLETTQGLKRKILMFTEKIACYCSTKIIAVSPSLRNRVIQLGISTEDKICILGSGSGNGINFSDIDTNFEIKEERISEEDIVLGYVGRITKDKGVEDLLECFLNLTNNYKNIKLLILGDFEKEDAISNKSRTIIETHPNIIYKGFQNNPYPYYKLMDIFVFPTYREGFGNVSIEAAFMGLPVITTNATGAIDTVIDGKTGLIYEVGNVKQLEEKIEFLIRNPEIRKKMGIEGKKRVIKEFSSERIWNELDHLYKTLLKEKGLE